MIFPQFMPHWFVMEGWTSFTGKWCLLNCPFMNFIWGSLAGCMFRYNGLGTLHYALLIPDKKETITICKEAHLFLDWCQIRFIFHILIMVTSYIPWLNNLLEHVLYSYFMHLSKQCLFSEIVYECETGNLPVKILSILFIECMRKMAFLRMKC